MNTKFIRFHVLVTVCGTGAWEYTIPMYQGKGDYFICFLIYFFLLIFISSCKHILSFMKNLLYLLDLRWDMSPKQYNVKLWVAYG